MAKRRLIGGLVGHLKEARNHFPRQWKNAKKALLVPDSPWTTSLASTLSLAAPGAVPAPGKAWAVPGRAWGHGCLHLDFKGQGLPAKPWSQVLTLESHCGDRAAQSCRGLNLAQQSLGRSTAPLSLESRVSGQRGLFLRLKV